MRLAAILTSAAAIATWIGYDFLEARYVGAQITGFGMFLIAHPFSKLGMMLLFVMGMSIIGLSLIGLFLRPSIKDPRKLTGFELAISILALSMIGLSALLAAYTEMGIRMAIREVGPVRFEVIAPQKLEQIFTFGLALWPCAIAFGALLLARAIHGRKQLKTACAARMRTVSTRSLSIFAASTVLAAIACWIAREGLEARYIGYTVGTSFYVHTAHPATLLGLQVLMVTGLVLSMAAVVHGLKKQNPARFSAALFYAALGLLTLGIVVTLHSVISYQKAFAALGQMRFELYVPSIMTQLYILGVALWPAAFVFIVLLVSQFRAARASA